ncbi:CinA-like protein [uncultured Paludibacter sp.]|nr:CinA-like protein [uncultured Paludibacter sp.]
MNINSSPSGDLGGLIMVEIITIGDEILIGQIVDTNSAWMAVELNKAGFQISQVTSIHDDVNHIKSALDLALFGNDIVLITGGLGPTKDDITKHTLAEYFDSEMIFDESVLKNIENIFRNRNIKINELTRNQALVPEKCTVIQNLVGTAPVMWFEHDGKVVVSMPGVPFEMKRAMSDEIIPRLTRKFKPTSVIHKTVQTYGTGESALALQIADWENSLPENLHLAYLPNFGIVKLRLSGTSEDPLQLEFEMNQQIHSLVQILGNAIFAFEDKPLEVILLDKLKKKNWTISTAESCTGGNIAHRLTLIPGASEVFKGSVVSYSNEVKKNMLGVSEDDLKEFGAVSKTVVEQMALGACKFLQTDISVAVSGIAGPTGGTEEKPIGTVWIAVANGNEVMSKQYDFGNYSRENFIERSTMAALMMILENI